MSKYLLKRRIYTSFAKHKYLCIIRVFRRTNSHTHKHRPIVSNRCMSENNTQQLFIDKIYRCYLAIRKKTTITPQKLRCYCFL